MQHYPYKMELHAHTHRISPCAEISGAALAKGVAAAGYHLLHVTDHLRIDTFDMTKAREAEIDRFLSGFYEAKDAGARLGLTVLCGAELTLPQLNNDYLLFGLSRGFFRVLERVFSLRPAELLPLAHAHGIVVVQAHPFRPHMVRTDPADVDGVEALNLNPNHLHHARNEQAMAYAEKHGLLATAGSDVHLPAHIGRAAVYAKTLPQTEQALAALLQSRDFRIGLAAEGAAAI